jgi:hypothetical protein
LCTSKSWERLHSFETGKRLPIAYRLAVETELPHKFNDDELELNWLREAKKYNVIFLSHRLIIPQMLSLSRIPQQTQKQALAADPRKFLLHKLK